MIQLKNIGILAVALVSASAVSACDSEVAKQTAVTDDAASNTTTIETKSKTSSGAYDGTVAKPGSPYAISYRIVGTPIVGSPVVVDLQVRSALGPQPVNLDYRINDATSMMFSESQPAHIRMEMADNESSVKQQVTVIPQREGRFFLNVSASFETETGTQSTVMAVPIQVGTGSRVLQEHGTVELDENGEAVRVLTND
jgi:hypothetical protein